MSKSNKRQAIKNILINITFSVLILYFGYNIVNQQIKINEYNKQIKMYANESEKNKLVITSLEENKLHIKDEQYIEAVARQKLGYVKPYEKVFVDKNK